MLPIMLITLAYILGIIGGLYNICIAPFCLFLCFILYKKERKIQLLCLLFFIVGISYTSLKIHFYDNRYLEGNISIIATVTTDAIEKNNTNSYIIKNEKGDKFILYAPKSINIEYGSKIIVKGNLTIPDLSRNQRRL